MIKKLIKKWVYRLRGEYTVEQLVKRGLKVGSHFDPQLGFELDPSHCWLITIGDNVTFGPHVQILAHDASTCAHLGYAKIGRVRIGNNVFIGAGSIVLPGVSIGNDAIIGAGSVVTHSVPEKTVYAGNPAREVCSLEAFLEKNTDRMRAGPCYGEEYTLRRDIDEKMKRQQYEELKDGFGFVK